METYRERKEREQQEEAERQERRKQAARESEREELEEKIRQAEELLATGYTPEKVRSDSSMQQVKRKIDAQLDRWYQKRAELSS